MRWGGYWRWLRAPLLIAPIWIRRGRCGECRRTHALLPDLVLVRRLDEVAVIRRGLAIKVLGNVGLLPIALQLDVPHSTVRIRVASFSGAIADHGRPLQRPRRGTV
jgi:hypothetical protein